MRPPTTEVVLSVSLPPAWTASRAATPSSSFAAAAKRAGSYDFKSLNVVTESARATLLGNDRTCGSGHTPALGHGDGEALTANPLGRLGRCSLRTSAGCENDNEREG